MPNLARSCSVARPTFLSVVEPAQVPTTPVGPGSRSMSCLQWRLVWHFSAGAAILLEYLDDTLKSSEDVRHALGLMTLGSIPPIDGKGLMPAS